MGRKIVLPINENPSVITCIHHAYPCAIIESPELADIDILQYENNSWKSKVKNCSWKYDEGRLKIVENALGNKVEASLWHECGDCDEICVQINYFKPRDIARYVDLFLFSGDIEEETKLQDKRCGIRWNPFGLFIEKTMFEYDTSYFNCIKLRKCKRHISVSTSRNRKKWKFIGHLTLPNEFKNEKLNIGIHVFLGEDNYIEWKMSNFIQLLYNNNNPYKGINLDYYFFPRKNIDNSYGYFVNYLETHYDSLYDAEDGFKSIEQYIRWNVDHHYYVNISLDEFYVPDRVNFGIAHYNHYNLFYGYNDERRVFYIMGYGKNSTPIVSELPYEIVKSEYITSSKIVRYRYKPSDVTNYKFNIESVKMSLQEFVHSHNSALKFQNLLTQEQLWYGVDIIKKIAETEIESVKADKRIAFCLVEHFKMMRERVDFLCKYGYICECDYKQIVEKCDDIVRLASIILGLVMKNKIIPIDSEKIIGRLLELYSKEKEFCMWLLKCLD